MRGEAEARRESPKGEEAVGSSSSKAGSGLEVGGGGLRNDAFWAGVVRAQRKGSAFSAWVTRHQPQLAPSAPPQPGVSCPQLDGNSFSASMVARATCSARDGRQLVLLTPSTRVARPAENRGVGRPEGAEPPLDSGEGPPPGATETHLHALTSLHINPPSAWHPQPASHLPGHRGGRKGALERDRLSKQPWDLRHGTPAEPQCPCLQSGENEGSLPMCHPLPQKSPVPANCLATATAHCPPCSSLCSSGHLDTQGDNSPDGKWGHHP